MSLFSGMKLVSTGSDKSNEEDGDLIKPNSKDKVSQSDPSTETENNSEMPEKSDPSGFAFILGTSDSKDTGTGTAGINYSTEINTSKTDNVSYQGVCNRNNTPTRKVPMVEPPDDPSVSDDLNFDLDPIKITGGEIIYAEKPHPIGFDLQDLDFSRPVYCDSETLMQEQDTLELSEVKSESSFSFIFKETPVCSKEDIIPIESQSTSELHLSGSQGFLDNVESVDSKELGMEEARRCFDTELGLLEQLQKENTTRLHCIKKSISDLEDQVSQLARDCVSSSHNLVKKWRQLQVLQEQQQQAIDEEDYEKAEELHHRCQALEEEIENNSTPLPYNHPVLMTLLTDLQSLCDLEKSEHQRMTETYQELVTKQRQAVADARGQCLQWESNHSRKMQEDRSELDRDFGHLQLDKEHLHKREVQLSTRIDEGTANLRQTRDLLIVDRAQVQEEIKNLEVKLASLHLKETSLAESVNTKDQEIEAVKMEFSKEIVAMEREKEDQEEKEIELRRRGERLEDEERRLADRMTDVKEMEASESKLLADLEECLVKEKLAVQDLTDVKSRIDTDLWQEEDSMMVSDSKENLLKKKDAVRQKTEEVQHATSALLLSQTRVVTLRQRVSDTEGDIAALTETKQLAVSGRNFSEARRLTDEIKKLTAEGQRIQQEMEELTQRNEETSKMVKLLREDVERLQEELNEEERRTELSMKEKLLTSIIDLKEHLQDSSQIPLIQTLQRSQLAAVASQVRYLCLKHTLPLPAEVEELSEDLSADGGTSQGSSRMDLPRSTSLEMLRSELEVLETRLQHAVEQEDYETADSFFKETLTEYKKKSRNMGQRDDDESS